MAKRRRLQVLSAGEKYEGWMPFSDGEPMLSPIGYFCFHGSAEVYATRKDACANAEDVRHVTIIVTKAKQSKGKK